MRVFVVGGSGAIGAQLLPALVAAGHEVTATSRNGAKGERLRELGASPVTLDVLDREATIAAVREARPEAIIHQGTALGELVKMPRNIDSAFEETNRLRTEGTENLIAAAKDAGVRRMIAQSYAGWTYERTGGPVKSEEDPFDDDTAAPQTLDAMRREEAAVASADGIEGITLRYGGFYGPNTSVTHGGETAELVVKRRFPIVGSGDGVWSFCHIEDAAHGTIAALERGTPGVYNIVDDDPAPTKEWLPTLAAALGAKPPRHIPAWLGKLAAGQFVVNLMESARGASNAKAKSELGFTPRWESWRRGFREGLG
jgi:nucleoside-diphosphate-sugar epimerase